MSSRFAQPISPSARIIRSRPSATSASTGRSSAPVEPPHPSHSRRAARGSRLSSRGRRTSAPANSRRSDNCAAPQLDHPAVQQSYQLRPQIGAERSNHREKRPHRLRVPRTHPSRTKT
jgi:hypothetical protein